MAMTASSINVINWEVAICETWIIEKGKNKVIVAAEQTRYFTTMKRLALWLKY
jgi:hypothetical protein